MSFEVQQWFLMRRVKAEIATRVNERMSEVSNQYHRLVGTTMLEGSTPLLFSPELPSNCTSPLDLGLRTCPQFLALQLWFGPAVEHDFAADFESMSTDRNILCHSSLGCSRGSRLVSHSAFYWASRVHLRSLAVVHICPP